MKAWHVALAAGVSIVAAGAALVWRTRSSPAPPPASRDAGPIRYVDTPVNPPSHWETLPVFARFESDPTKYERVDGVFSATEIVQGKLGDLAVSYKRDLCVWGGSARRPRCASSWGRIPPSHRGTRPTATGPRSRRRPAFRKAPQDWLFRSPGAQLDASLAASGVASGRPESRAAAASLASAPRASATIPASSPDASSVG